MNYAGFWRRFAARLVDCLILLIPGLLVSLVIPLLGGVILSLLYWPVFESSALRGTPGKVLMGLAITDEAGGRIGFKQAFIRYLMSFVSGLFLGLGYLMNLFTARRQTLHDIVAGTLVIRRAEMQNVDWVGEWTAQARAIAAQGQAAFASGDAPPATPHDPSAVETLEALHRLHQAGALTDAEYNAKKEELLKKI